MHSVKLIGLFFSFVWPVAGHVCGADCHLAAAGDTDDLQRLQGTWTPASVQLHGKEVVDYFRGVKVVISGTNLTSSRDGKEIKVQEVQIDPNKSPKHLNLKENGKVSEAIYSVDGDYLKVGINDSKRPTDFSVQDSGVTVIVIYKRQ